MHLELEHYCRFMSRDSSHWTLFERSSMQVAGRLPTVWLIFINDGFHTYPSWEYLILPTWLALGLSQEQGHDFQAIRVSQFPSRYFVQTVHCNLKKCEPAFRILPYKFSASSELSLSPAAILFVQYHNARKSRYPFFEQRKSGYELFISTHKRKEPWDLVPHTRLGTKYVRGLSARPYDL